MAVRIHRQRFSLPRLDMDREAKARIMEALKHIKRDTPRETSEKIVQTIFGGVASE
ncbi:hypothetical protein IC620_15575 [Hazenella sp. IB182357]|uniref:Uncharacterized protein n=1 Tax=Polycladospora coralii TaxID=2771432 RepID=A0A926NDF6_9BACL|nr:hypothetical protein [Polycladospora coralii]MBD1373765.1 hypothetical protein [Polycladospora coralii]